MDEIKELTFLDASVTISLDKRRYDGLQAVGRILAAKQPDLPYSMPNLVLLAVDALLDGEIDGRPVSEHVAEWEAE